MPERDRFTGGDPAYLRTEQYGDGSRVTSRMNLLVRWSTAPVSWYRWVVAQADWAGARVLEVGSGTGALWVQAADLLPEDAHVVVTDASVGMAVEAVGNVRRRTDLGAVWAQVVDAHAVPFRDDSFDRVVANHVLYHLEDPALAVGELARVLRPDGVLLAATIGPAHLAELAEIRHEVFGRGPADRTADVFGIGTGEPILRSCFEDVEWRSLPGTIVCREPGDVVAFLESTPPLADAGPRTKHRVRAAVERRFDGDGSFAITQDTGLFVCRRPR